MDDLLSWRGEFPILDRCTYLISNSLGAMPRTVYDRVKEYADTWATEGVLAWEKWVPMVLETPKDSPQDDPRNLKIMRGLSRG